MTDWSCSQWMRVFLGAVALTGPGCGGCDFRFLGPLDLDLELAPYCADLDGYQADGPQSSSYVLSGTTPNAGDDVDIFGGDCDGTVVASATSDDAGVFAAAINVNVEQLPQVFAARVRTRSDGRSPDACCRKLTVAGDPNPPPVPSPLGWTLLDQPPCTHLVSGITEPRILARVFSDAACQQELAVCGTGQQEIRSGFDGHFVIYVDASSLGMDPPLYARVMDRAGNVSACAGPLAQSSR